MFSDITVKYAAEIVIFQKWYEIVTLLLEPVEY